MEKRLYPSAGLHGRVAHQIGRRIVSGEIAEGAILPREAELSEQFAISRQAVREGLKVLAAKGLVNSRRRAGTSVMPRTDWHLLDPDVIAWHPPVDRVPCFLNDLIEMRRLIEPAAAEYAAKRGGTQRVARIAAALEAMKQSVGDPEGFFSADIEFHLAVFSASRNALIDRLSNILAPLMEASFRVQQKAGTALEYGIVLHQAVYDAIAAGEGAGARAAMEAVIASASAELGHADVCLDAPERHHG
ncbi:MAG: FadR/GntR family transcriptional regulator [Bauldia sp.]